MAKKPLKTELHHWWPRTLSEHWCAADQMVSVIRPNGEVRRAPPGAFGGITNAHHMKLGGPWDSTFEPVFNQPDSEIADFVSWIFTLEASRAESDRPMLERILAQPLSHERHQQMARIVASLLARSPRVRYVIKLGTEYYREQFGLADPTADKNLIAANQRGLYDAYRKRMESGGRWAILFTDNTEFIAGDGFLHNFPASVDGINSGKKLVLPILPTATIVYMLPSGGYPSEPKLVTLRVHGEETTRLNHFVQVYARDLLFYRSQQPIPSDAFRSGEYREFQFGQDEWLDALLDDLSQFNQWGKNGAAGMCSRRPYSESIVGNRLLDQLARRSR